MTSLFSRLYPQRSIETRNPKEDFLTEVLAYVLENDPVFLKSFLQKIGVKSTNFNFSVKTQHDYGRHGVPDLQLVNDDDFILIECKIECEEGTKQLDRYGEILNTYALPGQSEHLVYLTRYYVSKPKPLGYNGNFCLLRWFEVYELLQASTTAFANELKKFIKELNMHTNDNLSAHDLNALLTVHPTLRKLDQILDVLKPKMTRELNNGFYPSVRANILRTNQAYYNRADYEFAHTDLGFSWWWGDNEVYAYAAIFVHKKTVAGFGDENLKTFHQFFKAHNWNYWGEHPEVYAYERRERLVKFLAVDGSQVQAISRWLEGCVDEWIKFKAVIPTFFLTAGKNGNKNSPAIALDESLEESIKVD